MMTDIRMGKTEAAAEEIRMRILVGQSVLSVVRDWAGVADMEWRMDRLAASGVVVVKREETHEYVLLTFSSGGLLLIQPFVEVPIDAPDGNQVH